MIGPALKSIQFFFFSASGVFVATFTVGTKEKQQVEGKKRPVTVEVDKTFAVADVKYCKYLLNFK